MPENFISKLIKTVSVTLSTFLTLVRLGAVILLFLPADLYNKVFTAVRLFFCQPVFIVVCGLSAVAIYCISIFCEERLFGFDPFEDIPTFIFYGNAAVALVLLCLLPQMPPLPRIKASIPLTCLFCLSCPALFYSGLFGIINTSSLATAKYKKNL